MSRGASKFYGVVLSIGLTVTAVFFIAAALSLTSGNDAPVPYLLMAVTIAGAYFLLMRGPLGKAIARMLDGGHDVDPLADRHDEIDELMARGAEDRLRLLELEERLDFAERMLAQRPLLAEPARLNTPV